MRISGVLSPRSTSLLITGLMLTLAGLCAAQETNFSTGPQYLMTNGSALFARPIATPSLSLETQLVQPAEHDAASAPQVEPSSQPAENESGRPPAVNLFSTYSGIAAVGEVAISFHEPETELITSRRVAASIFDAGVTELLDEQQVRQLGDELTPAEAAVRWRARRAIPSHTYTNDDIDRLRQKVDGVRKG
jgi:hypothetical protein